MIRIFKNLKGRDWCFILICAALVVTQVWLDLTMPDYTQKLTESVSAGSIKMSEVWENGGMMLLCAFGSMAASVFCGFFAAQVAANFAKTLREKLYDHIMDFSNSEINKFSTPSLITRTTNDVVQMQMLIAMGMQIIFKAPITAVWAITKISSTSVEWTTAILICVGIIVAAILVLVLLAYPKFKQIQSLTDRLNDTTRENISGVRVVRAFNAEQYQEKKFDEVNTAITSNQLFTSRTMGFMMPVMTMAMSGLTLAIYWVGAYLINNTEVMGRAEMIGNMTAFTQYALQVVGAFMMLVAIFIMMPRAMVSAKRINEVLETKQSMTYPEGASDTVSTAAKGGMIEFRNVSFSYQDSGEPCLRDISFTVQPGETFAIIGATGTGKSTLVNLIPRLYDVTDGSVSLGGYDVRDIDLTYLRSNIGVVSQDTYLFNGTIRENLLYAKDGATQEELENACRMANIHDFIVSQPDGYDTMVGNRGLKLSGGEKQRISIARVLLKDPQILILDEATSALDSISESSIQDALDVAMKNRTCIVIAHRLSTILASDKILVISDGHIVQSGDHEALLEQGGVYKELYETQFKHLIEIQAKETYDESELMFRMYPPPMPEEKGVGYIISRQNDEEMK